MLKNTQASCACLFPGSVGSREGANTSQANFVEETALQENIN